MVTLKDYYTGLFILLFAVTMAPIYGLITDFYIQSARSEFIGKVYGMALMLLSGMSMYPVIRYFAGKAAEVD